MTKMDGKTPDIAEENIAKLKQLFPEVCCEDKVDFDKLKQILGDYVDDDAERYNFTWNGKGRALKLSQTPSTGTLRPCKEESKNWDDTENLYIEGDNLEVLKLLQKSYYGKVKMIYIDPPYNTGNDFVYNDDFKDGIDNYKEITGQISSQGNVIGTNSEMSGRFHTNWLNMMYPRLRIARNLLMDDGVAFVSVDDNEAENLKKICDEIFGASNFLGTFVINSTPNARDYGHIGKMHEYCFFYGKNSMATKTNMLPDMGKKFKYQDCKGGYNIHPLYNSNEAFHNLNRPNLFYPFYLYPDEIIDKSNGFYRIGLENKENAIEIFPPKSLKNSVQFVWRWGREKALKYMNDEIVGYEVNEGEYRIVQKMRHSEKIIRSLLTDTKYSSRRGTAEVENILNGKIFSFPKPLALLMDFCAASLEGNDIVLDFFSGSATTADAVMQLNAKDGGNRKHIMIQLPEETDKKSEAYKAGYKNICEIGKERIRRAGEKIKVEIEEENKQVKMGEEPRKVPDIGFKVFKLDSSNIKKWQPNDEQVEETLLSGIENFMPERSELDVVYEIMLKLGLDLSYPVAEKKAAEREIYTIGMGSLMICLEDDITIEVAEAMIKLHDELRPEIWKVVFKDNGFKDDSTKINICEMFKCAGLDEDAFTTI